ncbi:MAG: hypothetical protein P8048_14275, partial [Calditrichia bacterium]
MAYTTDKTGGSQVAIRPADGSGEETILTNRTEGYFYQPVWAPGSDKLAFSDNQHILWYMDLKQKKLNQVDQSPRNEIHDYSWSPDGLWIAYSKTGDNNLSNIYLYSISGNKTNLISSGMNSDSQPVFSPDGKYLYFISARHENPTMSETEFNIATLEMDGVYVTTLQKKESSPFAPRSDEGVPEVKPEKEGEKTQPWKPGAIAPIQIDLDGLMSRAVPLEIPSADISGLAAAPDRIYYLTTPPHMIEGPLPRQAPELSVFDMK